MSPTLVSLRKEQLAKVVGEFTSKHSVTWEELKGPERHCAISALRQDFMLLLSRPPWRWSLTDIGAALNRDHSTVVYGIGKAKHREGLARRREALRDAEA